MGLRKKASEAAHQPPSSNNASQRKLGAIVHAALIQAGYDVEWLAFSKHNDNKSRVYVGTHGSKDIWVGNMTRPHGKFKPADAQGCAAKLNQVFGAGNELARAGQSTIDMKVTGDVYVTCPSTRTLTKLYDRLVK